MTYINHVTLNSGHMASQRREDVGEATIAALSDMLDGLLTGARLPVPGQPSYLLSATQTGHNLIVTLWRGPWERRQPILTTATALKSRSAPGLWRMLHETSSVPLATDPASPPSVPWTADRIELGALLDASPLAWTGDMARCLAWAWHSYRRAA